MKTKRIVTSAKGSWKWQDAYRISTYEARVLKNGKTCWVSINTSDKYSEPQLRRCGYSDLPHGSLHHVPLTRDEADAFAQPIELD